MSCVFPLYRSWHVKLGDFGMATEVCNGRASTICGTEEYMAPELHFGETESYGQPADVFSMGMVFIELATRLKVSIAAPRSPRTKFVLHDEELRTKMHAAPPSFIELAMQVRNIAYDSAIVRPLVTLVCCVRGLRPGNVGRCRSVARRA